MYCTRTHSPHPPPLAQVQAPWLTSSVRRRGCSVDARDTVAQVETPQLSPSVRPRRLATISLDVIERFPECLPRLWVDFVSCVRLSLLLLGLEAGSDTAPCLLAHSVPVYPCTLAASSSLLVCSLCNCVPLHARRILLPGLTRRSYITWFPYCSHTHSRTAPSSLA